MCVCVCVCVFVCVCLCKAPFLILFIQYLVILLIRIMHITTLNY